MGSLDVLSAVPTLTVPLVQHALAARQLRLDPGTYWAWLRRAVTGMETPYDRAGFASPGGSRHRFQVGCRKSAPIGYRDDGCSREIRFVAFRDRSPGWRGDVRNRLFQLRLRRVSHLSRRFQRGRDLAPTAELR